MRWRAVGLALLSLLLIRPATAQELKFGFTPVLAEAEMRAEFEPLMAYLSEAIGRKVSLYIAKNYGDLRTQMEAGTVDIGSFSPFAYVDATRGGKLRIIVQSILDGSATYHWLIAKACGADFGRHQEAATYEDDAQCRRCRSTEQETNEGLHLWSSFAGCSHAVGPLPSCSTSLNWTPERGSGASAPPLRYSILDAV